MKQTILLFIAILLVSVPGFASESFVNDADEQLVAEVGQTACRIIAINGSSDFETLSTMSDGHNQLMASASPNVIRNKFTAVIEGEDHQMFSAKIAQTDQTACTMLITYHPSKKGTHHATLIVYDSNSSEPVASIKLLGNTKVDDDKYSVHTRGNDFTGDWNGVELAGSFVLPNGFDPLNPKEPEAFISDAGVALGIAGIIIALTIWYIDHAPELYFNVSNLSFNNVTSGTTKTGSFQVWGANTKHHRDIKVNLVDNNKVFSINKSKIDGQNIDTKIGGHKETVNVTYKPKAAGTHSAKVTLKSWIFSIYFYIGGWVKFTGTAIAPNYTTSVSTLSFGSVVKGKSLPKTFTVKGNLNSNLTLKSSNSNFIVSPTTITPAQAAAGKTVTVTYKPTAIGSHSGVITISGGGATTKKVSVSGKCIAATMTGNNPLVQSCGEGENENEEITNGSSLQTLGNSSTGVVEMSMNDMAMDVKIYAEGQEIVIESPVEQSAIVSDIAGHARRVNLQAGRNVIPAGGNGVHIVRVGEKSAKLMLR